MKTTGVLGHFLHLPVELEQNGAQKYTPCINETHSEIFFACIECLSARLVIDFAHDN